MLVVIIVDIIMVSTSIEILGLLDWPSFLPHPEMRATVSIVHYVRPLGTGH